MTIGINETVQFRLLANSFDRMHSYLATVLAVSDKRGAWRMNLVEPYR